MTGVRCFVEKHRHPCRASHQNMMPLLGVCRLFGARLGWLFVEAQS